MNLEDLALVDGENFDGPDGYCPRNEMPLVDMLAEELGNEFGGRCEVRPWSDFQDGSLLSILVLRPCQGIGLNADVYLSKFGRLASVEEASCCADEIEALVIRCGFRCVPRSLFDTRYSGKFDEYCRLTWGERYFSMFWPRFD